jgi:hypothetical protein
VWERITLLGEEYEWQYPHGRVLRATVEDKEWCYFATPWCTVRVPATYEDIRSPASYDALHYDPKVKRHIWQKAKPPLTAQQEAAMVEEGTLWSGRAKLKAVEARTGRVVELRSGSVQWNAFRQRYIMLAADENWAVHYLEAAEPDGLWGRAVQVLSPGCGGVEEPVQHDFLDQDGGKVIYIEGIHAGAATPRYTGCQVMHRLSLTDARLGSAQRK